METALPAGSNEPPAPEQPMAVAFGDQGSYQGQWVDAQSDSGAAGGDAAAGWPSTAGSYGAHASYGSYEGYESYGNHGGDWGYDPSALETVGATEVLESARALGKRGRNAIPSEILEVKQEELVKNRPREDQVKLTGIAFGPAYQVRHPSIPFSALLHLLPFFFLFFFRSSQTCFHCAPATPLLPCAYK